MASQEMRAVSASPVKATAGDSGLESRVAASEQEIAALKETVRALEAKIDGSMSAMD